MVANFDPIWAPARPESIAALRNAAAQAAADAGAVDGTVAHVRLAVSEAATNAVLHAFPRDSPGRMRLEVAVSGGELLVSISDDGWGMRPRDDSPGLGLGLPLITRLTTRMEVSCTPGGGTRLHMRFPLQMGCRAA